MKFIKLVMLINGLSGIVFLLNSVQGIAMHTYTEISYNPLFAMIGYIQLLIFFFAYAFEIGVKS